MLSKIQWTTIKDEIMYNRRLIAKLSNIIEAQKLQMAVLEKMVNGTRVDKKCLTLTLPPHLAKTYNAIVSLANEATAEQISGITGNVRAVESGYANQLCTMGLALKKRHPLFGRMRVFSILNIAE